MPRRRSDAPQRHGGALAGADRGALIVAGIVVAFIVYGSLFPFVYVAHFYPGGALAYLFGSWWGWDRRGDMLGNVLLYMPLGFFAVHAMPARLSSVARLVLTTVGGAALSVGMELLQFHDAGRVTAMGDVYADTLGALAGAAIGRTVAGTAAWPMLRDLAGGGDRNAVLLLAAWIGYRLYPYVPTIDLHKYWHAIRPLLENPLPSGSDPFRLCLAWLLCCMLVEAAVGAAATVRLFPALAGAIFLAKILIIGNVLKSSDVGGAVVAYVLWLLLFRRSPARNAILAVFFALMVAALRLESSTGGGVAHGFGWIPFLSMMRGSTGVAIQSFLEKAYLYGGLIWLLTRAGMRLLFATLATALLLLVTSLAETHIPGRSAEITDAAMALCLGAVFHLSAGGAFGRR